MKLKKFWSVGGHALGAPLQICHCPPPRQDRGVSPDKGYPWTGQEVPLKIGKQVMLCCGWYASCSHAGGLQGGHIPAEIKFPVFSLCYEFFPCVFLSIH